MKTNISQLFLAVAALCAAHTAMAEVRLPKLVSDGLVLQRNEPIKLWGYADAGETVEKVARVTIRKTVDENVEVACVKIKGHGSVFQYKHRNTDGIVLSAFVKQFRIFIADL